MSGMAYCPLNLAVTLRRTQHSRASSSRSDQQRLSARPEDRRRRSILNLILRAPAAPRKNGQMPCFSHPAWIEIPYDETVLAVHAQQPPAEEELEMEYAPHTCLFLRSWGKKRLVGRPGKVPCVLVARGEDDGALYVGHGVRRGVRVAWGESGREREAGLLLAEDAEPERFVVCEGGEEGACLGRLQVVPTEDEGRRLAFRTVSTSGTSSNKRMSITSSFGRFSSVLDMLPLTLVRRRA